MARGATAPPRPHEPVQLFNRLGSPWRGGPPRRPGRMNLSDRLTSLPVRGEGPFIGAVGTCPTVGQVWKCPRRTALPPRPRKPARTVGQVWKSVAHGPFLPGRGNLSDCRTGLERPHQGGATAPPGQQNRSDRPTGFECPWKWTPLCPDSRTGPTVRQVQKSVAREFHSARTVEPVRLSDGFGSPWRESSTPPGRLKPVRLSDGFGTPWRGASLRTGSGSRSDCRTGFGGPPRQGCRLIRPARTCPTVGQVLDDRTQGARLG